MPSHPARDGPPESTPGRLLRPEKRPILPPVGPDRLNHYVRKPVRVFLKLLKEQLGTPVVGARLGGKNTRPTIPGCNFPGRDNSLPTRHQIGGGVDWRSVLVALGRGRRLGLALGCGLTAWSDHGL